MEQNKIMEQKKEWIYIVQRSGFIVELCMDEDSYKKTFDQWQKGDLLMIKSMNGKPMGVNATDVVNILFREDYEAWVDSTNPARFVKKGFWYTRDDRTKPYRVEKWKEKELGKTNKLEQQGEAAITSDERAKRRERLAKIREDLVGKRVIGK